MRSEAEIREYIEDLGSVLGIGERPEEETDMEAARAALSWALGDSIQFDTQRNRIKTLASSQNIYPH